MTAPFSVITPALGITEGASFGPGFVRPITIPRPAAGAAATVRLDGAETVRPMVITISLTTSATVANRGLFLTLSDDDGNVVYRVPQSTNVVASTTTLAQWLQGLTTAYVGGNGDLMAPLPGLLVYGGYTLTIGALNLDATDQFTLGRGYLESYPAGPAAYPVGTTRLYAEGE